MKKVFYTATFRHVRYTVSMRYSITKERMVFTLHVEEDESTTTQTEFFADFLAILRTRSL